VACEPASVSERRLRSSLRSLDSAVVAFSGGVDSAVVLAAAVRELGSRALAVTGSSASIARSEVDNAIAVAKEIGARHEIIETREFDNPSYRANAPDRCYHCKQELYSRLVEIARTRGFAWVTDGCNADDGASPLDRRPGQAAAKRLGVRSPLAETGIGKKEVRKIAALYGLTVWNKPATPCLSSRVPHGTPIEIDDLRRIDLAERYLRANGFATVRVRHFGAAARIEVPMDDLEKLHAVSDRVARALRSVGYERTEIDPRGYRTGSLNERSPELKLLDDRGAG
jgi:pyridinium-3,5-biscarboxylic acid mononucleotide sulfurtransferase